jgi:predicted nuclease with TOPRIM domain
VHGGGPIPEPAGIHDFKRLEEAVIALVDRYRRAQTEITSLRRDLAERDVRLRSREEEIRELAGRRQDVAKRLDQLIDELERLDAELAENASRGT